MDATEEEEHQPKVAMMSQGVSQPLGLQDDRTTTIPISGLFGARRKGNGKRWNTAGARECNQRGLQPPIGCRDTITVDVLVMSIRLASRGFIGQGKGEAMKALGGASEPFLGAMVMLYHMVERKMQDSCQYGE